VESPTLKAVEKDRNTVMVCSATGNPEPSILWLKDYIPVDLSDPRIKLLHTGQCLLADWLSHNIALCDVAIVLLHGLLRPPISHRTVCSVITNRP